MAKSRPLFTISDETAKIVAVLVDMPVGAEKTFSELSHAVGFRVDSSLACYHSARDIALRDHGVVTDAVAGVGVRRLNGAETVGKSARHMKHIKRTAQRAERELYVAVKANDIGRDERLEAENRIAKLGIIYAQAASPHSHLVMSGRPKADHGDRPTAGALRGV